MPKDGSIKKALVIGSGPIVIGQAAEFDYAGTQACLALKEEGYEVVLCNSNPATIMTDADMADKVYMEPLTPEFLAKILRVERPDAVLAGIGGQTGLNLAMELEKTGVLAECRAELLGTSSESIAQAEDRERFKELCERLGEPVLPSETATSLAQGIEAARRIGYPLVLRPAFTLGGTGGGFAADEQEFLPRMQRALAASPVGQVLLERSVQGYKEIEMEVMRDADDTAIVVCGMENVDPVGIHTGDSIVVCPVQTLANREYQMLRDSALRIIRALKIEGGCNVQFALDPKSFQYYVIEVNPRVSRSSALASKASGYPIARVAAKIGVGMRLSEIRLANTPAAFEPALDYVVVKMPRFPFDKFAGADNALTTQMKSTGEVMAVGRTLEESLLKAVRSLETGVCHIRMPKFDDKTREELLENVRRATDERLFAIAELLRRGEAVEEIAKRTGIDRFFLCAVRNIVRMEREIARRPGEEEALRAAKRMGFCDREIARLWQSTEENVFAQRKAMGLFPAYKMIDSCAAEFDAYIPYFYSTYEQENESLVSERKKILVLGSGPIRIGQGVEFDYATVHAVQTIRRLGCEAILINNNPETVSTDYTCSDKLYFEPLCAEDICNIVEREKPEGVIVTLGGQTAVNLAGPLRARGVRILGTGCEAIERAENRDAFEKLLEEMRIPQPKGRAVTSLEEGKRAAAEIGYPVLVRPSFVLGGRAMQIVSGKEEMRAYLQSGVEMDEDRPVLVDKYICGKEVEVDAVCDGERVFVPGIMELVERTGVHSGDSISVYPPYSLSDAVKETIYAYTEKLGLGIGIVGLFNLQFIVDKDDAVYCIEVNPRASRSVPFLSKATGCPLTDIAVRCALGESLRAQGIGEMRLPETQRFFVKAPAFSFAKLRGLDAFLSPEMKSTGEAIGYDKALHRAMYKAMLASGLALRRSGTVLFSVADEDKEEALPLARRFYDMGFSLAATTLTGETFRAHGLRTRILHKPSEGSEEVLDALRAGQVAYVINTRAIRSGKHYGDGLAIRQCAAQRGSAMLTSLDTARMLLSVLEELTLGISTIDGA